MGRGVATCRAAQLKLASPGPAAGSPCGPWLCAHAEPRPAPSRPARAWQTLGAARPPWPRVRHCRATPSPTSRQNRGSRAEPCDALRPRHSRHTPRAAAPMISRRLASSARQALSLAPAGARALSAARVTTPRWPVSARASAGHLQQALAALRCRAQRAQATADAIFVLSPCSPSAFCGWVGGGRQGSARRPGAVCREASAATQAQLSVSLLRFRSGPS